jgi:hypothetical protein
MYEKPQYPTPDGYKRLSGNPYKTNGMKDEIHDLISQKNKIKKFDTENNQKQSSAQQVKSVKPAVAQFLQRMNKKPPISEKAALLIAQAIKGLLHSK